MITAASDQRAYDAYAEQTHPSGDFGPSGPHESIDSALIAAAKAASPLTRLTPAVSYEADTEVVDMEPLSPALMRRLVFLALGRKAQHAEPVSMATAVLDGMLERRGLVRTVKHRDYTRSYALTDNGRDALAAAKEVE